VYVRQSSPQQVLYNCESTERQYALAQRATQLGWSAELVSVIDEDQGHSGATAEGWPGFQSLLAQVALDQVGIILGLETSRPPKRVERFTGGMIAGFLERKYARGGEGYGQRVAKALKKGEWLLGDLARHLGMPATTLHHWRKLGWLRARKLAVTGGLWAIRATGEERRRLARLRRYQQRKPNQPIPAELTTPQEAGRKQ
jgi:hypothetical protein